VVGLNIEVEMEVATLLYSSDYGHIDEGYVVDTPIWVGEVAETSTR